MKNLDLHTLARRFRPNRATIRPDSLFESEGWLSNGYVALKKSLEPKISQGMRLQSREVKMSEVINKTKDKLSSYQKADVVNYFQSTFDNNLIVKIVSKDRVAWANPRLLSYVILGLTYFKNLDLLIGESIGDPIVIAQDGEIMGLVMSHRGEEE